MLAVTAKSLFVVVVIEAMSIVVRTARNPLERAPKKEPLNGISAAAVDAMLMLSDKADLEQEKGKP